MSEVDHSADFQEQLRWTEIKTPPEPCCYSVLGGSALINSKRTSPFLPLRSRRWCTDNTCFRLSHNSPHEQ